MSENGGDIYSEDQLSPEDALGDPDVADELDRGYSPPEKLSGAMRYQETAYDEAVGETLDQRVEQEVPEPDPYAAAQAEAADLDRTLDDGEVGEARAGRLVDPDEGAHEDTEQALVGDDAGIDGAAASSEEAAVHVVPEDGEQV